MSNKAQNYTRSLIEGQESIPYDSTYTVVRGIYNQLGGEARDFDSTYSIVLAILEGLEDGTIVPGGSVVSISNTLSSGSRVATLTINGTATDILVPDFDPSGYTTFADLNEATASVKGWVGEQEYATLTSVGLVSESVGVVSESVYALSSSVATDLESYAKSSEVESSINSATQSVETWVGNQGYLTEHQDISGLATTSSVTQLSESVAQSISEIVIPDVSIYATTESLNTYSSSMGTVSASFDQRIEDLIVSGGAVDPTEFNAVSSSVAVLGTSVTQLSESVASLDIPDVSVYALSASVTNSINDATESVKTWVGEQGYLTQHQSLAGLFASTSYSSTDKKIYFYDNTNTLSGEINAADFIKDGMVDSVTINTGSNQLVITFNTDSGKEDINLDLNQIFNPNNYYTKTGIDTIITGSIQEVEAWVGNQGYLTEHQDISGLATTSSVTQLSESVASDFANLDIPDVSGLATTASVTQLSSSVAQDFASLVIPDISGLATTSSVTQLSESVASDFANLDIPDISGLATTSSVNTVSESVTQLSSSVASDFAGLNIPDVSGLATTSSVNLVSESVGTLSSSFASTIPSGTYSRETWTFTLTDSSSVSKVVLIG